MTVIKDDVTGRDDYIHCLSLAYAYTLMLVRPKDRPPFSDLRDVHALLRAKYPRSLIAPCLRSAYAALTGEPMPEQRLSGAMQAFEPGVDLSADFPLVGIDGKPALRIVPEK